MNDVDGRDLDLNLLRVFVVVAELGSVTAAGRRLYLTQPAISAALKRLRVAVGAPLFAREGRGIVLTDRGRQLLDAARPHLRGLVQAVVAPHGFDPAQSERTVRLGLSDMHDVWLLPPLLRILREQAPRMRLLVSPVQFRTVGEAIVSGRVDLALTVADELPAGVERQALFTGGFTCLYDPRHTRLGRKVSLERYLAHRHVVVSYNDDFAGLVEDALGIRRDAQVAVASFHVLGTVVDGSPLLATVPALWARHLVALRPHLRTAQLPFAFEGQPIEVLWRGARGDDGAVGFVRQRIVELAAAEARASVTRGGRAR